MQYTENYHLPQWVKEDRIMMDDFNAAMADIESGLTSSAAVASEAKSDAAAARQTAGNAYAPDNKPYVVGTYTGTNAMLSIDLGFKPSLVIAFRMLSAASIESVVGHFCIAGQQVHSGDLSITDNGFRVSSESSGRYPAINAAGVPYQYIAFQ